MKFPYIEEYENEKAILTHTHTHARTHARAHTNKLLLISELRVYNSVARFTTYLVSKIN